MRTPDRTAARSLWFHLIVMASLPAIPGLAAAPVQFNRDIRPILSENCFACHGPDPGTRKAGLRLDTRDAFFSASEKHPAPVIRGNPGESPLYKRIISTDPDELMPPPASHKALKPAEREMLRRWIEEGASWQPHWSLIKPERPAIPRLNDAGWVRNPIDSFILAKLESKGLKPAPEASRRALIRRVSLDLIGLPPQAAEVEAVVKDASSDWYDRYVEHLLTSAHYGEHRARYWLDAARYSDTHGLHFDNYREIWPYRDWVIRSFNQNQPFDQFTVEQIAGDLLPDPTIDQKVATGFQRCNVTTNEGGTIEEENLVNYANDRVSTLSWVWLGLTANCAACHDHKFDPITMRDFYSMAAFFRNTTQGGFDHNRREGDVFIRVPQSPADAARMKALPAEVERARSVNSEAATNAMPGIPDWSRTVPAARLKPGLDLPGEVVRLPLHEGTGSTFTVRVDGEERQISTPATNLVWRMDGPLGPAPVLNAQATIDLGDVAGFDSTDRFSVGGWVHVPEGHKGSASILGRVEGDRDPASRFAGWELSIQDGWPALSLTHHWSTDAMKVRANGERLRRGEWMHVLATYDGSSRASGVRLYIDGVEQKVRKETDGLEQSVKTPAPLRLGRRSSGDVADGFALQDMRIFGRVLHSEEARALAAAPYIGRLLARKESDRTPRETDLIRGYYLITQSPEWRNTADSLGSLEAESMRVRNRSPYTHVQAEKTNSIPTAHVLYRGQYDQRRDAVTGGVFAALHAWPAGSPTNRLGLAQWLVSPENPLTARVMVNRYWQEIFGVGLVKTSEDLGIMGELPSHPELLDWLAVQYRESGWDTKRLIKLLVTSATYRQDAAATPEKLEKDPQNRLLSRGPRFRMDAEMVRDYALAASGLLVSKVGGPSVKPYQPPGVWEAVAMPESNTRHYKSDHGDGLYRRSLYTFWKRAAPPALLEVFNAPSRETACLRRERTDTPLQALVTLNGIQFVEAARYLAQGALREASGDLPRAIGWMAQRLLARPLAPEEASVVQRCLQRFEDYYERNPGEAKALLKVGEKPVDPAWAGPQLAALTMAANQLLNLDEVLNK